MAMEEIQVCRICLAMDVKMHDLRLVPLNIYFEQIVGINPLSTVDLPPYVCFECGTLLTKYHHFRNKCLYTESFLHDLVETHGKIYSQQIKQLDRKELNLLSTLKPMVISEDHTFYYNYDETQHVIKEEPEEAQEHTYLIEINPSLEDDYNDSPFDAGGNESSDDEPLSLHKSNKKKETETVRKGGKKKREMDEEIDTDLREKDEDIEGDLLELGDVSFLAPSPEIQEELQPKKKRGRPRKSEAAPSNTVKKPRRTKNTGGVADDDLDLEEFVTVIKLSTKEQMEEITKRQHSSNYVNAPFQCKLCYKGFIDTHAWKHHVGKHDPNAGDMECVVCKFRFKTKRALQKHAANHEKKFACKSCSYVSKTVTQAKQHQRWHKGVTYTCQYCDEVSTKWTSYLSHVRIKHPSDFICGVCGYSFVSKLGLTMHKTMMHKDVVEKEKEKEEGDSKDIGPYCEQCDVKFISVEAFKRHMVTSVKHTKTNDFTTGCRVCGETFKTSEELRLHHRKEHARKRPKNYGKKPSNMSWPATCEHCAEEIPNAREFWTHFRRVHPDKNYPIQKNHVCDICGKSFRGNAFLVYHKRTHFEERAYKCAQCPKAFFNRTNLQMHEKTHSDSRPYPCNVCFKAFKCKGALDRHYRSHTGVKPYECEVCGKAFGQSNSRKLHVRTVHLKQPAPYVSRSRLERRRTAPPLTQQFIY